MGAQRATKNQASVLLQEALTLHQNDQGDRAETLYRRILQLYPHHFDALQLLAILLAQRKDGATALCLFDRALALQPHHASTHNNRGNALYDLHRYEEALDSYNRAITIWPDYANALYNRGNTLRELQRYEEALDSHHRALQIKPDGEFWYGMSLHTKMKICDWRDAENQWLQLAKKIEESDKVSTPFPVLALLNSLPLQRKAAEVYVEAKYSPNNALGKIALYPRHDKIRIGYFSADFHGHAMAYLLAELFETHDKSTRVRQLRLLTN